MPPATASSLSDSETRATVPPHHPLGAGQRTLAVQRRESSRAEAEDALARRYDVPGDVAAGVHGAAGRARAIPMFGHSPAGFTPLSDRSVVSNRVTCSSAQGHYAELCIVESVYLTRHRSWPGAPMPVASDKPRWTKPPLGAWRAEPLGNVRFSSEFREARGASAWRCGGLSRSERVSMPRASRVLDRIGVRGRRRGVHTREPSRSCAATGEHFERR